MAKSQRKGGMSQLKRSAKGKTRGSATRGISQMNTRSTGAQKTRKGPMAVGGGIEEGL